MKISELVDVKRAEPALWISRIALFESLAMPEPKILDGRDIELKRGLNIVEGIAVGPPQGKKKRKGMSGHSVGKSTFCRLIRYALGDESYGRPKLQDAIENQFPMGAVGISVWIDGEEWSAIRPFSKTIDSVAAQGVKLEVLAREPRDERHPYAAMIGKLEKVFIKPLPLQAPVGAAAGSEYGWNHLLAWLARDQEARYREFFAWRAGKRSGAILRRVKDYHNDTRLLVREVLGLLTDREVHALREEEKADSELQKLRKKHETDREHDAWLTSSYFVRLGELMKMRLTERSRIQDLFNHDSQIAEWLAERGSQIEKRQSIVDGLRLRKGEFESQKEKAAAYIQELADMIEARQKTLNPFEEARKQREMNGLVSNDKRCIYGNLDFHQCPAFLEELARLNGEWIDFQRKRQEFAAQDDEQQRKAALREWLREQRGEKRELELIDKEIKDLSGKIEEGEAELSVLKTGRDSIELHCKLIKEIADRHASGDFFLADERIKKLESRRSELETKVNSAQTEGYLQGKKLEGLFTAVIRRVLEGDYEGKIELPPDHELSFSLSDVDEDLSGEATNSLIVLLADFTAVLWSAMGCGSHPGLLIHDSPREADLHVEDYMSYLRGIFDVERELGGANAPFQYIVTTTTEPPNEIVEAGRVRLTLKSEPPTELLFRKRMRLQLPGE